jgi:hypothetical protein
VAEGDAVAAVDLVRDDAEALPDHPAQELGREEAVVAAEQEAGRDLRPGRRWDHPGQQHQQVGRHQVADQGGGEPAEGLGHHDQVAPVADGLDHRLGVLRQPGRVVLGRQVRSHHLLAPAAELGGDQVPEPAAVAGAVDQRIGGHARIVGDRPDMTSASARAARPSRPDGRHRSRHVLHLVHV